MYGQRSSIPGRCACRHENAVAALSDRRGAFEVAEDGVDLDGCAHGEVRNADDTTSRGSLGEELSIDLVDSVHVSHVLHEDVDLDGVFHHMVNALDDGLDVLEALLGLGLHTALDQSARCGIDAELSGDIVVVRECNGLGRQRILRSIRDVVRLDNQTVTILDSLRRRAVAVRAQPRSERAHAWAGLQPRPRCEPGGS